MYYDIDGLCPRLDLNMGRHGFCIKLYREWPRLVANRCLTQEEANTAIESLGRVWLDSCGYDSIFDPDNCGHEMDPKKPPGLDARPSYRPNHHLRVTWGEWGPEHITVPGNACGLDIGRAPGEPPGGRTLLPHNIDSSRQKLLLLIVFTWFASDLSLNWILSERKDDLANTGTH